MDSFRVQQDIAMGKTPIKSQSKNQPEMLNGDFFTAFLQMITQGGEKEQLDILSQLNGSDTDPNAMAMEMMADLLNGNAGYDLLMNDSFKSAIESSQLMNDPQMLQQLMTAQTENLGKLPINELNAILSNETQIPLQKDKQIEGFGFQRQMLKLDDLKQLQADIPVNALNAKGSFNSSEMLFKGDMNFQNAIMQAQRLMKGQSKTSLNTSDDPNTQALQQTVNQTKFDTILSDKQVSSQTTVDVADLAQQVKNGLSNGSLSGQKEFSVKLKPEGLGEITIKLVESQDKLTVSIVTATAEVAKLLNNDLSTLREAMRAMQIDVKDVVVQSENNFSGMQQDLQQQMFQGQSNQFANNGHQNRFFSEFSDVAEPEILGSDASYLTDERMNIYV